MTKWGRAGVPAFRVTTPAVPDGTDEKESSRPRRDASSGRPFIPLSDRPPITTYVLIAPHRQSRRRHTAFLGTQRRADALAERNGTALAWLRARLGARFGRIVGADGCGPNRNHADVEVRRARMENVARRRSRVRGAGGRSAGGGIRRDMEAGLRRASLLDGFRVP